MIRKHDSCPTCRRPLLERNTDDADATNNSNTAPSPAEDAYDPSQLQSVLQHLQGVSNEGLGEEPESLLGASSFPTFLFGPETYLANSSHNEDRSEYHGMYS